jgi:hypothetical protein
MINFNELFYYLFHVIYINFLMMIFYHVIIKYHIMCNVLIYFIEILLVFYCFILFIFMCWYDIYNLCYLIGIIFEVCYENHNGI